MGLDSTTLKRKQRQKITLEINLFSDEQIDAKTVESIADSFTHFVRQIWCLADPRFDFACNSKVTVQPSQSKNHQQVQLPHTEGDGQIEIVAIDSLFSAILHFSGDNLKDAVESFKSSVWQQGWDADEKVMKEYGNWSIYKKLANGSLEYSGLMRDM